MASKINCSIHECITLNCLGYGVFFFNECLWHDLQKVCNWVETKLTAFGNHKLTQWRENVFHHYKEKRNDSIPNVQRLKKLA